VASTITVASTIAVALVDGPWRRAVEDFAVLVRRLRRRLRNRQGLLVGKWKILKGRNKFWILIYLFLFK
jgi:hypothetical protein